VELPAEVTHYYLAGRRPFMSLSDLDELGRSAVLAEMADLRRARTQHRPFGARYMELRELTEGRLRELFEAAGGKPERKNPHYFVLGTSEWYERLAESMSAVSIPLADLPADQTTLTEFHHERVASLLEQVVGEVRGLPTGDDLIGPHQPASNVQQLFGGLAFHPSKTASRRISSSIRGLSPA
jgi:hypothetical protein